MADEKKKEKQAPINLTPKNMAAKIGTSVSMINKHPIDGKYIVKAETGEFYLIPTGDMDYSFVAQQITITSSTKRPYGFDSEISELGVLKTKAQEALYREGHVAKGLENDQIIRILSVRGVSPIVKDKNI